MARLILLNGPPGGGKSTLARRLVIEHPTALDLDLDELRGRLDGWRRDPEAAGRCARELGLGHARAHLITGHDVIVPQYLGRLRFLEQLSALAEEIGATVHEIVLLDSRQASARRFLDRAASADASHIDARYLVDRAGGPKVLGPMYDRLLEVVAARPASHVIRTTDGQIERAYAALLAGLGGGAPPP